MAKLKDLFKGKDDNSGENTGSSENETAQDPNPKENWPKEGTDEYTEAHRLQDESEAIIAKENAARKDYDYSKKKEDPDWDTLSPDVRQLYIDKVK